MQTLGGTHTEPTETSSEDQNSKDREDDSNDTSGDEDSDECIGGQDTDESRENKSAIDIEMICLREEINEKSNIIAQQAVLIEYLESQKPVDDNKPLQVVPLRSHSPDIHYVQSESEPEEIKEKQPPRSMIKRIKLKGRKGTRDPDFEYSNDAKKGKRKAIEAPPEKNKKAKFSFRLPKNGVTKTLAKEQIKQLRHVVGITSGR
ncbi:hypothetical protein QJS10_CPA10g01459 [Acorus calamus]|uniref:Uncharacterized protein n=1 Tax=Acorus calamus TaxID=4465 RepID=A0AAV9DXC0_ACOCL|nr:hypothetical protein QJS10_CPA10g01459 [Acorus calamus]